MTFESLRQFWYVPLAIAFVGVIALFLIFGAIRNGLQKRHPDTWTKIEGGPIGWPSVDFTISGRHREMKDALLTAAVVNARRLMLVVAVASALFAVMCANSRLPLGFRSDCERSDIRGGGALGLTVGMRQQEAHLQMRKLWSEGPWPNCTNADDDDPDFHHGPEYCPTSRVQETYHVNSWSGGGVVIAYFDDDRLYRLIWYRACGYIG